MTALAAGTRVGQYSLERQLGEGGQGSVWQARLVGSDARPVALKIVPVRGSAQTMIERFRREAEALIRLSSGHPSLVACHGIVEDPAIGVLAVVMDKVDGADLEAVLEDPRCDMRAREVILLHIARALAHLHAAGFVHRDIKPQNILVTNQFFVTPNDEASVKLVDFGIAVPILNPKPLTEVGTVIGTPGYMSPERIDPLFWQARPGLPTEDVWAFGVVAYEAFFGVHPTRVRDEDASLASYAEHYRAAAASREAWPSLPAGHPWARALGGALALRAQDRLPTGAAVVAVVTQGPPAVVRTEAQPPASLAFAPTALNPAAPPRTASGQTQMGRQGGDVAGAHTEVASAIAVPVEARAWQAPGGAQGFPVAQHSPAGAVPAPKGSRALIAALSTLLVGGIVLLVGAAAYPYFARQQGQSSVTPLPETSALPAASSTLAPMAPGASETAVPVFPPPVPITHHEGVGGHGAPHTTHPAGSAPPIVNVPSSPTAAPTYQPPEIQLPPFAWPPQVQPQPPPPQQQPQPPRQPPVGRLPPSNGGGTPPPATTPASPGGGRPSGGRPPPP